MGLIALVYLVDRSAGEDVELVGVGGLDTRENFVISGGADHSGVVTGELRLREEALRGLWKVKGRF